MSSIEQSTDPSDLQTASADNALEIKERDRVAGVDKAMQVISAFGIDRGPKTRSGRLTLADVAAETGLSRAAARRYVLTLLHLGYVSQSGKLFALTPKVLEIGQSYHQSVSVQGAYSSVCLQLSHALREASTVSVLSGDLVICVASHFGEQLAPAWMRPGFTLPAHATANGRVLLSQRSDDELLAFATRLKYDKFTPNTVGSADHFLAKIRQIRDLGYETADQEIELGFRTVAVPLKNMAGNAVAALGVSVSNNRMSIDEIRQRYLPAMLKLQALAMRDSLG